MMYLSCFGRLKLLPFNPLSFARHYGKANTPKSKPNSGGPARKQSLMKNKKTAKSVLSSAGSSSQGHATQSRISALTEALFEPSQPVQVLPDPSAPEERALLVPYESVVNQEELPEKERFIRQTWARFCSKRAHDEKKRETRMLIARVKALNALRIVNEKWYEEAIKVDYSLAPSNRRIATLTMPRELGISCSKLESDEINRNKVLNDDQHL